MSLGLRPTVHCQEQQFSRLPMSHANQLAQDVKCMHGRKVTDMWPQSCCLQSRGA